MIEHVLKYRPARDRLMKIFLRDAVYVDGMRSPRLHAFQRLEGSHAIASDHHCPASVAILPYIWIAGLWVNLLNSIVDDEIEEDVESSKRALNLSSALDVDCDALVEEALELWLRYFRHLDQIMEISKTSASG